MSFPCMIATTVTNDASRPTYDWTQISGLREYEVDAGDHWIFDKGDAGNLAGGLASTNLMPVGTAPTYTANSLVTAEGMNGLRTIFPDAATMTWAGVFKHMDVPTVGHGRPLISSETSFAEQGGSAILDLSSAIYMRSRQASATNMAGATTIAIGGWMFVAMSCNDDTNLQQFFIGGLAPQSATVEKTLGDRNIALGNAYTISEGYLHGCECAELIVWPDAALNLTAIQSVYARSKIRMSRRELAVF